MKTQSRSRLSFVLFAVPILISACSLGSTAVPGSTSIPQTPTFTPAASAGSDSCLQGTWIMPTSDLERMMAALLPMPGLHVTSGELLMAFDGDSYEYQSSGFVLRVDLGTDQYMEATASFRNTGSFSTGLGKIIFTSIGSESEVTSWTAYKNGESVTVPGSGPQVSLSFSGENPYRCTVDRLEIDTYSPTSGTLTMFFSRQS